LNLLPKYLIKLLESNGFIFKRAKGSHQVFFNADSNKTAIVPFHGGKDLKKERFWLFLNRLE